jgi:hypothetical protein
MTGAAGEAKRQSLRDAFCGLISCDHRIRRDNGNHLHRGLSARLHTGLPISDGTGLQSKLLAMHPTNDEFF